MKLKENKKVQILFCVLSVVLIWGIYAGMVTWIKGIVEKDKVIVRTEDFDSKVLLQIDDVIIEEGEMNIYGWTCRYGADMSEVKVMLRPTDGSKAYVLKTEKYDSTSAMERLKCLETVEIANEFGFKTSIKKKKLKKNVCYEILLDMSYTIDAEVGEKVEKKVTTAQYLYNGETYNYDPTQFYAPEFVDEQMADVVANGKLCGYDLESGAWLYLHERSVYWVLDTAVQRNQNESIRMFWHVYSVNGEMSEDYKDVNRDFFFEDSLLFLEKDTKYRVAKRELMQEETLVYMRTGHYENGRNLWVINSQMILQN